MTSQLSVIKSLPRASRRHERIVAMKLSSCLVVALCLGAAFGEVYFEESFGGVCLYSPQSSGLVRLF